MKRSAKRKGYLTLMIAGYLFLMAVMAGCGSSGEDKASVGKSSESAPQSAAFTGSASSTADSSALNNTKQDSAASTEKPKVGAGAPPQQPGSSVAAQMDAAVDRKIIYKANVTMEVADYGSANTDINNLIHLSGGYLLQFSENRTDYEQSGTLVVKVPSKGFSGFIADLEKMKPKSIQRSVQGQDVTEEFVDLEARLKSKQAEEARLLDFMNKATKSEELVAFSSQIGNVQTQIEQIKGRMRYLEQNVAYSTVEIRLYQKIAKTNSAQEKEEDGFASKLSNAMSGSAKVVLGFFKGLAIVLAAALPVLVVAAVIAVPAYWIYRKRKKRGKEMEERAREIRRLNKSADESGPSPGEE
ncbi:DUF4349 domain-containing protein [Paenibacillus mesophilus]|uniref:DUF4349 domain-containing protein n=1 Tax=Paenibacillus mesophilus TaxID=2582849 RepID=UPI00110EA85F|nr:DUF4349 domain-containing protein [Paenibacillus mesophilus]TMV46672.1 DUF4349 domain-containing protein [Paenibacillus mesophilus]